jgi:hypothetical protein
MMQLAPLQRPVPSAKVALVAMGRRRPTSTSQASKLRGHQGGHSQDGRHAHGGDHGHVDLLGSLCQVTRDGRDLTVPATQSPRRWQHAWGGTTDRFVKLKGERMMSWACGMFRGGGGSMTLLAMHCQCVHRWLWRGHHGGDVTISQPQ